MAAYTTNPQVIHETIEGETIIINLVTGTYYSLRGVGREIWTATAEGQSTAAIADTLTTAYGGDTGVVEAVVDSFLRELESEQLVAATEENGAGSAAGGESSPNGGSLPFEAPKLEKYTDMQDIILLDPVHQVDEHGWPHAAPVES
jgi:hypothetical protein